MEQALKYINFYDIVSIILILFIFLYALCVSRKSIFNKSWQRYVFFIIFVLGFIFNFHQSILVIAGSVERFGIPYYSWNWPYNYRSNGLLVHLVQTGNRPLPKKISNNNRSEFEQLYERAVPAADSPSVFITILCESCWYDDGLLADEFNPLKKLATVELRGVSPVFGGGTPNASFEIISGLPSHNPAVAGIIYQEYRDFFAKRTSTLPSHLKANAFKTESLHNYLQSFWFRDQVEPKMGFSVFHGIEQMLPNEPTGYPRDSILYEHALSRLESAHGQKMFMHLATMYTHGPYTGDDADTPLGIYRNKLRVSIADMASFIRSVQRIYPEAVVLIYGDHKPALPETQPGPSDDRQRIGDVPVLLVDPNKDRASELQSRVNGKPFYCFTTAIAEFYYKMNLPISKYTNSICANYVGSNYMQAAASVPGWLYTTAMFGEER
ncbi:sulfatase-like hydrolase/transferase [Brucella oryzae]|uniref:sulfatase-like hydrolase/transferase n=1 Tax=Brucella oryzae TaxID=335286 RepID=UPI001B82C366|nr:sulfatase-like hydrolase/transferase [Brucella oryzae]MBR7654813.1 sulfatase-like hydrolase/transferase [Brucella oryzae]